MKLDPSRFDLWFKALNDMKAEDQPFPWQRRLFREWLCPSEEGAAGWPKLIQLPTASGKTALIDIAVLALSAGSPAARRRIAFVVDRRVVVDEAARRANSIADRLRDALTVPDSPLYEVSQSLLSLGGDSPLVVATLRGGVVRDDSWARSPAQPTVILTTVDQAGSRLMFRAYGGHGPRSWPIHAGLFGRDTLLIVDEAHCAAPFCETAVAISTKWQNFAEHQIGSSLSVVKMSATPGEGADFEFDSQDRADPVLKRRMMANKPVELVPVTADKENHRLRLLETILDRAQLLIDSMSQGVVAIVVNRVADARGIFARLVVPGESKLLLTGRVRGWDRDRLLQSWLPRIRAGAREETASPIVVVATQCIEVGANLDFDFLISEIASLDALRQRFGRVDRLGGRRERAEQLGRFASNTGMIVATTRQIAEEAGNAKWPDPIYGHTLSRSWNWMRDNASAGPLTLDFGIGALESILPEFDELQRLCRDAPRAYPLLPAYLDLLAQTSPPPQPSPEISAFLHGTTESSSDVTVVWRCDLPEDNPALWPQRVSVQPPLTGEGCPVPIWEFRRWIAGAEPGDDAGDLEGVHAGEEDKSWGRTVLRWRDQNKAKALPGNQIVAGDVVVVPSGYGGCDECGWSPSNHSPVSDIGDAVAFVSGRRRVLRLETLAGYEFASSLLTELKAWACNDDEAPPASGTLKQLALMIDLPQWLRDLAFSLSQERRCRAVETSGTSAIVGSRGSIDDVSTAEDSSTLGTECTITRHTAGVRKYAKRFAQALLPPHLAQDVVLAACLHDVGKADPRFQAWLRGGDEIAVARDTKLLAKSGENPRNRAAIRKARILAKYPEGARHEVQSLALIADQKGLRSQANDWDLVQHLVVSHHGFGRPFVPVACDMSPVEVSLLHYGSMLSGKSDHDLHRLDSGIADRYWFLVRRYGWWGLAWLETIVRLADHRRSEDEERLGANRI